MGRGLDWGGTTRQGFTPVPRVFLQNYVQLGIAGEEAMFVLHVLDFSYSGANPFPKVVTLAKYVGKSEKTIRTYIRSLRDKGFLITKNRKGRSNEYDFAPLFEALKACAPDANFRPDIQATIVESEVPEPELPDVDGPEWPATPLERKRPTKDPARKRPEPADAEPQTSGETSRPLPMETPPPASTPSKRISNRTEVLRGMSLRDLMAVGLAKTKVNHGQSPNPPQTNLVAKRMKRFLDKEPEEYHANDMELVFKAAWQNKWSESPSPGFHGKERSLAKKLIDDFGPENTARVITEVITRWEIVQRIVGAAGYPAMGFFWGYRATLFPLVLEGELEAAEEHVQPTMGAQAPDGGYTESGSELGWGDVSPE